MFKNILNYEFKATYSNQSPIENIESIDNSKLQRGLKFDFKNSLAEYIENIKR